MFLHYALRCVRAASRLTIACFVVSLNNKKIASFALFSKLKSACFLCARSLVHFKSGLLYGVSLLSLNEYCVSRYSLNYLLY